MMATEANQSKSVDASVTSPELTPAITLLAASQNAPPQSRVVNGAVASLPADEIENKQLSDIVDDLVNSAEVSISGGSDTEASRNDGGNSKNGDKGHTRTSSTIKKPVTFKSVSVNKSFLGSKAPVPGASSKPGDKPSLASPLSAGQSAASPSSAAARPRLVAKVGSGLRDGVKASGGSNGKAAGTPDANAVWNKNRPPPPVEPKKFTDEELKKYGIHMANRLAPDDARGPGNWADIDDDDEDWIPGEIQWNDGTKVTIPQADEPAVSPVPAPAVPVKPPAQASEAPLAQAPGPSHLEQVRQVDKPRSPAPGSSPSVKPGVLVAGKALVLKGAPEKPTLVARPPAPPAPIKSPWATLPPIEKALPITIDGPGSQPGGRPTFRDGSIAKSMTPPPAKEIAADDFSRASGPLNPNRELFNSQSGRYEPVSDRRGAGRNEAYSRHPAAVLQRPIHSEGPAEPSAAFQTSRSSGQDGPFGRRRGSSNVSGGSGSYLQRLPKPLDHGLPPPADILNVRRESFTGGGDSPVSPRNFSPSGARHHGPQWQSRASPQAHHLLPQQPQQNSGPQDGRPTGHMTQPPQAAAPRAPVVEDVVMLQKKMMAEKRDAARQRKLEEEARLEEEKQKRIAAKLAAMGPAPESRSAKQAAARDEGVATTAPAAVPTLPSSATAAAAVQDQASSRTKPQPESKPMSVIQRLDGEKPNAISAANGGDDRRTQAAASQDGKNPPDGSWHGQGSAPAAAQNQNDRFSWGAGNQTSRIWGAPNSTNRSLGNGAFMSDLPDTFPDQPPGKGRPGPGPIGPPGSSKTFSSHPKPIGPPKSAAQEQAQRPAAEDERSRWASATMAADQKITAETLERKANQQREQQAQGVAAEDMHPVFHDSWKPVHLDSNGRRIETKERIQIVHGSTWKPSNLDENKQQAQSLAQPLTGSASTSPTARGPIGSAQPSRGSRFFPNRDVRLETHGPAPHDMGRNSPSPPPPDTVGHPAFDGDATNPHVALPPTRPVVRLPPSASAVAAATPASAAAASTSTASGKPFGWASPAPYNSPSSHGQSRANPPGAATSQQQNPRSNWQDKINHLLHDGKPSSHQKAMTVDPSSKGNLEAGHALSQATVSLPTFVVTIAGDDDSPTSKAMAESCFEQQEMGSLPPVRLPTSVAEAAWHPATPPAKSLPKRMTVTATSIDSLEEARPSHYGVLIPGMKKAIPVPSSARSLSNQRRSNRPRNPSGRHAPGGPQGSGHRGGGGSSHGNRSRDTSVSFPGNENGVMRRSGSGSGSGGTAASMAVARGPSSGGSHGGRVRGGGGGNGDLRRMDWSRKGTTPVQT